jgi:small subunit ribosomal protein S4
VTGEKLLQQLETRLDNVVYRMGFATSRRQARQLVRHGHIAVNGKKVNIPSYQVAKGQEISVREASRKLVMIEGAQEFSSHQPSPNWLGMDRAAMKGIMQEVPRRDEINLPVNEQLIVELYSK